MNNRVEDLEDVLDKVSILLTCYNKRDFLSSKKTFVKTAVEKGIEIVVVDDGSTDGSNIELRKIKEELKSITLLEQCNQGSAAARNTALECATRKYVVFLDFDDLLNLEVLKNAVRFMEQNNSTFGYLHYSTLPNKKINEMRFQVNEPKNVQLSRYRDEIYDSMGYWRYVYSRAYLNKEKLMFTPTFLAVGGFFILDDMFWLLHNSSLEMDILVFPDNWVLYEYFTDIEPSPESWLRFQKQVQLLPKALEVFINYLATCDHSHDMTWLDQKIRSVIEAHLRLLTLPQLFVTFPKYVLVLTKKVDFFGKIELSKIIKIAFPLVLFATKNSTIKILEKSFLGNAFLKGHGFVKR